LLEEKIRHNHQTQLIKPYLSDLLELNSIWRSLYNICRVKIEL